MITHADSTFLQVFIWERFPLIVPKPTKFFAMVMEEVTLTNG